MTFFFIFSSFPSSFMKVKESQNFSRCKRIFFSIIVLFQAPLWKLKNLIAFPIASWVQSSTSVSQYHLIYGSIKLSKNYFWLSCSLFSFHLSTGNNSVLCSHSIRDSTKRKRDPYSKYFCIIVAGKQCQGHFEGLCILTDLISLVYTGD